jgi:hypothetical protein
LGVVARGIASPSIVWPFRSSVMLSEPITSPSPGQFVRSACSVASTDGLQGDSHHGVAPASPRCCANNRRFDPRVEHANPIEGSRSVGESSLRLVGWSMPGAASLRPRLSPGQVSFLH